MGDVIPFPKRSNPDALRSQLLVSFPTPLVEVRYMNGDAAKSTTLVRVDLAPDAPETPTHWVDLR